MGLRISQHGYAQMVVFAYSLIFGAANYPLEMGGSMDAENPVAQSALTIKEVIGQVHSKKCLLPVPQEGELIWSPESIERLFDLLMQEHSIGQFIFWSVSRDRTGDYRFFDFQNGHEIINPLDPSSWITTQDNVAVVIDGKRRLASLYVGLLGLGNASAPGGNQETSDFLHGRKMYLNLLSNSTKPGSRYDFRFLTQSEATATDGKALWFEVGRILHFAKPEEIDRYLIEKGLEKNQLAKECLARLQSVIDEKRSVSCVVETDAEVGKVFLMFL